MSCFPRLPVDLPELQVEAGADTNAKSRDGRTPIQHALHHNRTYVADYLYQVYSFPVLMPTSSLTVCKRCNSHDLPPRALEATATETPILNKSSEPAPTSSSHTIVLLYNISKEIRCTKEALSSTLAPEEGLTVTVM
eukprot:768188-Hanusia_phi.AAC.5